MNRHKRNKYLHHQVTFQFRTRALSSLFEPLVDTPYNEIPTHFFLSFHYWSTDLQLDIKILIIVFHPHIDTSIIGKI